MEEGDFTIKMEDITKANGKTTKWMALVNFITKGESLPTKVNGHKMSLMAWVKFIMIIQ